MTARYRECLPSSINQLQLVHVLYVDVAETVNLSEIFLTRQYLIDCTVLVRKTLYCSVFVRKTPYCTVQYVQLQYDFYDHFRERILVQVAEKTRRGIAPVLHRAPCCYLDNMPDRTPVALTQYCKDCTHYYCEYASLGFVF